MDSIRDVAIFIANSKPLHLGSDHNAELVYHCTRIMRAPSPAGYGAGGSLAGIQNAYVIAPPSLNHSDESFG